MLWEKKRMTPYLVNNKDTTICCGCGSCAECCPMEAIEMKIDEEGFYYPFLDYDKCVRCGKCTKVCQYSNGDVKNVFDIAHIKAYAAHLVDENQLSKSSSGGAFWALASTIILRSGVVYGAAWESNHSVWQHRVDNLDDLCKLQGSKYVFCNVGNTYHQVKTDLLNGVNVLYSGTPCQINGLYAYLGKDYENLYTCDLICHGVPSQQYLLYFIQELEKKYKSQAVDIKFKDKTNGWRNPSMVVKFEDGQEYKEPIWSTAYGKLYHGRVTVMNACNKCHYATLPRKSDITIGDFWNYNEDIYHLGSEETGISTILVNSNKGNFLLEEADKYLKIQTVELENAMQLHLQHPAKPAPDELRKRFVRLKKRKGFVTASTLIYKMTYRERAQNIIYYLLKKLKKFRQINRNS
jgi:coenzyme F420-reducing hydrogenase beta subunit